MLTLYSAYLTFQYSLLSPPKISISSYFFVFEPQFFFFPLKSLKIFWFAFAFHPSSSLYTACLRQKHTHSHTRTHTHTHTHTLSPSFFLSIFLSPSLSTKEISFSDWWILNYGTLATAPANVIMMLSQPSTSSRQKTNTNTNTITLHPSP